MRCASNLASRAPRSERRACSTQTTPAGLELRAEDTDPHDEPDDPLAERLLRTDTRWGLDLDDPYP